MHYTIYNHSVEIPLNLDHLGFNQTNPTEKPFFTIEFDKNIKIKDDLLDNQFELKDEKGFYFRKDIGYFSFVKGKKIIVNPFDDLDTNFIQTLLNFPFACLFAQKGFLPIHASAVRYGGKTILFPGLSKAGKSSLAASIIKKGGKIITEDVAIFEKINDKVLIHPSYPLIKLSKKVNNSLKFSGRKPLSLEKKDTKRFLFVLKEQQFYKKVSEVDIIIFPEWSYENKELFMQISNEQSLIKIISTNFTLPNLDVLKDNYLKMNALIIKKNKTFIYERTKNLESLKTFFKFLNFS